MCKKMFAGSKHFVEAYREQLMNKEYRKLLNANQNYKLKDAKMLSRTGYEYGDRAHKQAV